MPARKHAALFPVLALSLLTACAARAGAGTSPTAAATPTFVATPTPVATPTAVATTTPVATPTPEPVTTAQVVAVAQQFWSRPSANECWPVLSCPITPRLAARVAELFKLESGSKTGNGDLWCRCQNGLGQTITGEVTPDGGIAQATWDTGLKMDFLMVVQDGRLLVDDTQCTGLGPASSLYGPEGLTPCEYQTS